MSDWAAMIDAENENQTNGLKLPQRTEDFDEETGIKTVIEYEEIPPSSDNEPPMIKKCIKRYKVERRKVLKCVARRKLWKKFGDAANDPPGPNSRNTLVGEDVEIQFISKKKTEVKQPEPPKSSFLITCTYCGSNHLSSKCPNKQQVLAMQAENAKDGKEPTGKFIPSRRGIPNANSKPNPNIKRHNDDCTIRVTNLSEDVRESDLTDLFHRFGRITRVFLVKDKITGAFKGFAYITFETVAAAATAIKTMNGFGYDHLVISVEWAARK